MKKTIKLFAVILCVTLLLCSLTACGVDGTYYAVIDGSKDTSDWIKIDGDSWVDSIGFSGSCEVDGNNLVMNLEFFGEEMELMTGVKSGNTIIFDIGGIELEYKK